MTTSIAPSQTRSGTRELQDKIVIVTGASSGIGAATAKALAAIGATVGLAARRVGRLRALQDEIEGQGGTAMALEMDVTDRKCVETAVAEFAEAYHGIDILVNNAGLMPLSDIESRRIDEWERMVDVNVKGVLNVTYAVLPHLIRRPGAHIVNMSSIAGRKTFKGLSVYNATKFALAALSDSIRMELGPAHNVRVTCIQPGAVETELYDHITDQKYVQAMADLHTQMTFLSPEDVARTIVFAVTQPAHVNVAEIFVLPTQQGW
jgi:NADP-dependent 3-hydroxy acid dehydrogenase YdfG